ncbi:hypothetical protein CHRYSEOSP005_15050 [Chryseobacterium sp. Alg-005]
MKDFVKDFIKGCMLFQCKDRETIAIGIITWICFLGIEKPQFDSIKNPGTRPGQIKNISFFNLLIFAQKFLHNSQ